MPRMRAPGRQQASLEKLSGQQMGSLVPLSRESPIPNTLHAFLAALVLMRVGGWVSFAWLACPGSCPLLTCSSVSNPRASCLLCRDTSGDGGGFFLLPQAQTSVQSPSSRECLASVSSRLDSGLPSSCAALRQAVGQPGTAYNTTHRSPARVPGYRAACRAPLVA